ncbi:anoctamin-10 [Ischnura elegans]|uniref:anoctamin-10 n=1 Tax=Ischnura elegans TaxID=197161 RepID=UPI001ED8A5D1|nr:anoctamin-10 [Ischnura elegans]XP_046394476.1 anoctamin-10 [Ischnura elegans]XP_046394477.1 anoctamin-10 [Ischnura elegans]XP_046394478.1 anoctamin-10 [Ischnura elegans]XP_046394479.1 anoctamin-10 [Ischnura elegans]
MSSELEEQRKLLEDDELDEGLWFDESGKDGYADGNHTFPQTYLVLKFSRKASSQCIEWLAKKIQGPRDEGGAELLVRRQPSSCDLGGPVILHISVSRLKLLEVAEEMEVRVKDLTGRDREFMIADIEDYIPSEHSGAIEEIFPLSERQRIVHRQLHITMRAMPFEHIVPGYPSMKLLAGESIVQALLREGILVSQYILHDEEVLKKLGPKWYGSFFGNQPLDEIHRYFGEAVTMYFTFLGFYTKALLIPMVLGLLQILFATTVSPVVFLPFFCLFNVVWVTLFLEIWRQKCSELAFAWGTIGMTSLDEPRPGFRGEMKEDPISKHLLPQYPRWKTNVKMYCGSIPIVLMCLVVAFYIMLLSFWIDDYLRQTHWMGLLPPPEEGEEQSLITWAIYTGFSVLPSVVYAVIIYIMNYGYRRFATTLTEWENHRTQSQFDRHRVLKLILFEFVNNFMALFYIAFYLHDMAMLKFQLALMLIFLQILNNIQEAVLPICLLKVRSSWGNNSKKDFEILKASRNSQSLVHGESAFGEGIRQRKTPNSGKDKTFDGDDACLSSIPCLDPDDPRIEQAIAEGKKAPYEGTYDDYLELFMQFGYVFLFASAYPAAAFWAVLNNFLEIRTDAFKLCRVMQRPLAKRVKDTGAWQRAFEAMGSLSVMTNCAILGISMWKNYYSFDALSHLVGFGMAGGGEEYETLVSDSEEPHGPMGMNMLQWALLVVAMEHVLLLIQCLLHYGIPDRPQHVRIALAREAYCSKQALKLQKSIQSRKQLRRHKTITVPDRHGTSPKSTSESKAAS